jgi:hypothetical protein
MIISIPKFQISSCNNLLVIAMKKLKEKTGWDSMYWVHLVQDRGQW